MTVFGSGYIIDYGGQDGVPGYRCTFNTGVTFDFPLSAAPGSSMQELRKEAVRRHRDGIANLKPEFAEWVRTEHHLVELERPGERATLYLYDVRYRGGGQIVYHFKGRGTTGQGNRILGEWNAEVALAEAHARRHLETLNSRVQQAVDRQFGRQATEVRVILPSALWELPLRADGLESDATAGGTIDLVDLSEMARRSTNGQTVGLDGIVVREDTVQADFAREGGRERAQGVANPVAAGTIRAGDMVRLDSNGNAVPVSRSPRRESATDRLAALQQMAANGTLTDADVQQLRREMGLPAPTLPNRTRAPWGSEFQQHPTPVNSPPPPRPQPAPPPSGAFYGIDRSTAPDRLARAAEPPQARRPVESLSERERLRMVEWLRDLCGMLGITEREASEALRVHPNFEDGTIEVRTNDGKIVGRGKLPACEKIDHDAPLPIELDIGRKKVDAVVPPEDGPTRGSLLELD